MPVERDPDRRARRLSELDCAHGLVRQRGLRAEPAADMLGDDPNLGGIELEPFGDPVSQFGHLLGRDMHGQRVAIETGDRGMRLEARVLLDCGAKRSFEQQRVAISARLVDYAAR